MVAFEKDIGKIRQIIDELKPKYTQFGGDIEFIDVQDKKVRIKPTGYCYR